MFSRTAPILTLAALAGLLVGCQREEKVEHYRQLRPEVLLRTYFGISPPPPRETAPVPTDDNVPKTDRLLAAIIPHSPQFWFFKLVGPIEAVDAQAEAFKSLIGSLTFDADGKPKWTLPKGWRAERASGTGPAARFATLKTGEGEKSLEVPVTSLELEGVEAFVANINRWRKQMGLSPVETKEQLAEILDSVKTGDGSPAFIVHLAGKFDPAGMGRPPFAGGAGSELPTGHPPVGPKPEPQSDPSHSAAETPAPSLKFDTPPGWQAGQPNAMRAAAFVVKDGSKVAEITVSPLPPFAGDIPKNVNRWRDQLKLPEADEKEIAAAVKPIQVGRLKGSYVEIFAAKDANPREAILAVIAPTPDKVWFIKLKGDADLAEREKAHFESFVKSIELGGQ